jgi:oligosaccharide reducing-end xylanase
MRDRSSRAGVRPVRAGQRPALLCAILALTLAATLRADTTPRNLFAELLGKSDAEITAKVEAGWQQLFYGRNDTGRVYYPVAPDMAYIADVGSGDVRSEGMSYGMMIAVQMNRRAEFDRIWKWARTHMYHASGPRRGYFAWHCTFDGHPLDPGSASDGEEWFAMALFFASHRWGDGQGIFDYDTEARELLREMLHKRAAEGVTPLFDPKEKQVVFAPTPEASTFTDPSYHLPAFYELWARWADKADRAFWASAATASRAFFHRAANSRTGLMPDYAYFDGRPHRAFEKEKGDFRFDAWRTPANVALDYAWWKRDPWAVEQSNRVLRFFAGFGPNLPNQFTLEGKPLSEDTSAGMIAMAAVAGLAADPELARPFVQQLWDASIPSGQWRYYNGLLYQLALLQVSGEFRAYEPRHSDEP